MTCKPLQTDIDIFPVQYICFGQVLFSYIEPHDILCPQGSTGMGGEVTCDSTSIIYNMVLTYGKPTLAGWS